MKILKSYHTRGGYPFNVVERRGDIALAEGGSIGYEVFAVQSHDGREIGGSWCEPAEYPPSNEQWGTKGWSFKHEASARRKFDELTGGQQTLRELQDAGFRLEPSSGRFWHWTESPGIESIAGKWFPCDMFNNGNMQYSDEGYESPIEAAKRAVEFFT